MTAKWRTPRTPRSVILLLVVAVAIGFVLGRQGGGGAPAGDAGGSGHEHDADAEATVWTCSMHPQIRLPSPGQCPICFMDLIPVEPSAAGGDFERPRLEMSEAARVMAEIGTEVAVRDRAFTELRLVGKIVLDETRVSAITAWVPGRLDRLYVDYTGSVVRKDDHLAEIYSPELLSAQQELQQALKTRTATHDSGSEVMRGSADATVEATREKLRLLGLTVPQIDRLEKARAASDHVTLYAQTGGVVVEKNAVVGDYVQTGAVIYRIADLDHLWVKLDAYESDLAWLRYGQGVEFTTDAVPGRVFHGEVVFISPTLDPRTRTSKIRVHVDNREGLLKPEMFVHAIVYAELGANGQVVATNLAGKWICPMHPEVVRDSRGPCDVCGMDLERAEDLGYVIAPASGPGPLLVPRSAVLLTGKRAVVYVEDPDADVPAYEGREVVLGPRAGDRYVVLEGLAEGERVVVNGNFKIDSALQIQARPSMMSPREDPEEAPSVREDEEGPGASEAFVAGLSPLYQAYFDVAGALAADDAPAARKGFRGVLSALRATKEEGLSTRGRREWMRVTGELETTLNEPEKEADLERLRAAFDGVSRSVLEIERLFGHAGDVVFYHTFCPMAFEGQGASWMQDHVQIDNPFYGSRMLRCGEVREELAPAGGE